MSDLISRQAAIDAVTDELDMIDHVPQWVFDRLEKRLKQLPTVDVVLVVMCKDCKYNATTHKCLNPDSFFLIPKDDDYCSYGERREE